MSESTHESETPDKPWCPLGKLDRWVASSPFHARILPFFAFVLMLMPIGFAYEWDARSYPFLVLIQSMLVVFFMWRYRRFTPEITLSLHWSAVVAGVLGFATWVGFRLGLYEVFGEFWRGEPDVFFDDMPPAFAWTSLIFRLVVTAMFVPVLEEVFFRSALLRALQDRKTAKIAAIQFLEDLPVIGDMVMGTKASEAAINEKEPLTRTFLATPLGRVTTFAVVINIVLWCLLSHLPRDWPGTVACGLLFIWVVWLTNRGDRKLGLGPVIWAHGLTNAMIVGYTIQTNDWQFL